MIKQKNNQKLVQDQPNSRVGIWAQYSFQLFLLVFAICSCVWLVSPTDGQRLEAKERAFTSLGLTSHCSQRICGAELIGHHLIMGLFCAGGNSVGLLFLQMLPGVLRREGQIVHQRPPPAAQRSDRAGWQRETKSCAVEHCPEQPVSSCSAPPAVKRTTKGCWGDDKSLRICWMCYPW